MTHTRKHRIKRGKKSAKLLSMTRKRGGATIPDYLDSRKIHSPQNDRATRTKLEQQTLEFLRDVQKLKEFLISFIEKRKQEVHGCDVTRVAIELPVTPEFLNMLGEFGKSEDSGSALRASFGLSGTFKTTVRGFKEWLANPEGKLSCAEAEKFLPKLNYYYNTLARTAGQSFYTSDLYKQYEAERLKGKEGLAQKREKIKLLIEKITRLSIELENARALGKPADIAQEAREGDPKNEGRPWDVTSGYLQINLPDDKWVESFDFETQKGKVSQSSARSGDNGDNKFNTANMVGEFFREGGRRRTKRSKSKRHTRRR
jgi:hypothetical protein